MKKIALLAAFLGTVCSISSANAYGCLSSSYGTVCSGRLGTVAVTRDGAAYVGPTGNIHAYRRGGHFYAYHSGSACYWHNGEHICP
jgi:hypothetical protein